MLRQNQVERWCRSKTGETQADAEVAEKQGGEPVKHPLVHQPAIDRGEGGVSRSEEHKEEAGGCRGEAISLCQEWLQRGKTPVDYFTVLYVLQQLFLHTDPQLDAILPGPIAAC